MEFTTTQKLNSSSCTSRLFFTISVLLLSSNVFYIETSRAANACGTDLKGVSGYYSYMNRSGETRCEGYLSEEKSNYETNNYTSNNKKFFIRSLLQAEASFLTKDEHEAMKGTDQYLESKNLHLEPYFFTEDKNVTEHGEINVIAEAVKSSYRLDATLNFGDQLKWPRNVIDRSPVLPKQIWAKGEIKIDDETKYFVPVLFYGDVLPKPSSLVVTFEVHGESKKYDIYLKCDDGKVLKHWRGNKIKYDKIAGISTFDLKLDEGDCHPQHIVIDHEESVEEFEILRKINASKSQ